MLYRGTKLRLYAIASGVVVLCTFSARPNQGVQEAGTYLFLHGSPDNPTGAAVVVPENPWPDPPLLRHEAFLGTATCETRTEFFAPWIPDWIVMDCVGVRRMRVAVQLVGVVPDAVALHTIETKVRAAIENGVPDFHPTSGLDPDRGYATLKLPDADGLLVVHWPALLVSMVRVAAFIVFVVAIAKITMAQRRSIAGERCPRCDYALPYGDDIGCPECGSGRLGRKPVMR